MFNPLLKTDLQTHICRSHVPIHGGRFGLSWGPPRLSVASGALCVWWGQLVVGCLCRQSCRSGAAEGPTVGAAFKGPMAQRIRVALSLNCLWKTRALLGKKRLDLKFAYKSNHGTGEPTSVQNGKQKGGIKSYWRSFFSHWFQFNSAIFGYGMMMV